MNEKVEFLRKWMSELNPQDKHAVMLALSGSDIERRGFYGGPAPGMVDFNKGYFGGPAPAPPMASSTNACPQCKRPY